MSLTQEDVNGMTVAIDNAVKKLRVVAYYLDQVWKDCKEASVVASSSSIVGGVRSVVGGVATNMTTGAPMSFLISSGNRN